MNEIYWAYYLITVYINININIISIHYIYLNIQPLRVAKFRCAAVHRCREP